MPGVSAVPGVKRVVKLSSNEGAFGPPPSVSPALAALAAQLHRYPDGGATALRHAIGARFGLDPGRIVCGAGSDDLIYLLCHIYGGPGTELVMTEHGFSIYQIAGRLAGCRVVKVAERDRTTDVGAILAAITPATRMVFIANPNNPTGTFLPAAEAARLRGALPPDVLLVLDAAYAEYVDRSDYDPGITLVDANDNTVMTRTFSKMFGLGGLRLGWAYAPPAIVENLNRVRSPFIVSALRARCRHRRPGRAGLGGAQPRPQHGRTRPGRARAGKGRHRRHPVRGQFRPGPIWARRRAQTRPMPICAPAA